MEEMKRLYVSLLALRRTRVENETGEQLGCRYNKAQRCTNARTTHHLRSPHVKEFVVFGAVVIVPGGLRAARPHVVLACRT